jgi:drug/metabolite transporter (DMT)-like permease
LKAPAPSPAHLDPSSAPSSGRLYGMVAFMIVSWALNFVIGKVALREIPALVLPGIRIAVATVCLLPIYLVRRPRQTFARKDWPRILIVSLCGITLNQFFFIGGLSRTSVAHMAVMISITPILVLILAAGAGQERFTFAKIAGMLVAMSGVLALELARGDSGTATVFGDFLAFCGTAAFAVYTVLGKTLASRYGSLPMNTLGNVIGSITLLPLSWHARASVDLTHVSAAAWWSVAYMAIFSTVIAYLVYYYALAYMPASRLTAFTYAEPVLAAILGFWILGEPVTWSLAVAGILVLAGVWVTEKA